MMYIKRTLTKIWRNIRFSLTTDESIGTSIKPGYYSFEAMKKRLYDKEPVFIFRAADSEAPKAIRTYGNLMIKRPGATISEFSKGVSAITISLQMEEWQAANPDKVKRPNNPA